MKTNTTPQKRLFSLLLSLVMVLSLLPAVALAQNTDRCTISFDANGELGTMESVTVPRGSAYTLPECQFTAGSDGYVFGGWENAGDPGQPIRVHEDMTLQAIWVHPSTQYPPEALNLKLTMPRAGDSLVMPNGTPPELQVTKAPRSHVMLGSPRWQRYDPADGSLSTPQSLQAQDILLLSIPMQPLSPLSHVTQVKLDIQQTGTQTLSYYNSTPEMPAQPNDWHIQWIPETNEYWLHIMLQVQVPPEGEQMPANFNYVFLEPNGGDGYLRPLGCNTGSYVTLPECPFTPPAGKVFDCWYFGAPLNPGHSMQLAGGNIEVYARWKDAPHVHDYATEWSYSETQHWHECSCGDKADVGEHTMEWIVDRQPTETQSGLKHQQCSVCGYALPGVEIPPTPVYTVSIRFNGNGGYASLSSMKVTGPTPEISVEIPDNIPERKGYLFEGWSYTKNGEAQLQPGETVVLENGEYVLYAVWSPLPAQIKYTLDYQAGLFSSPKDTVVSTMDSQATLIVTDEIPTKLGSRFLGWSTVRNGSVEYTPGDEVTLTSEQPVLKLYPVWEKAPRMTTYRLDYRAGLFTSPRDTVVKSDEDHAVLIVTDKVPRGRGTFMGWSTERNGAVQYHAGDQITLYEDSPTLRLYPVRVK